MSVSRRRLGVLVLVAAVLVAVALGAGAVAMRWWGADPVPDPLPPGGPTAEAAPLGVGLEPWSAAAEEGVAAGGVPAGTARSVTAALAGPLADPALGLVGTEVRDAASGAVLQQREPGTPRTPASTAKLLLAVAALAELPADTRLATRVFAGGPGEVVLVGGGDVTLARTPGAGTYPGAASVADLAAAVRAAGVTTVRRVVVDPSAYEGPALAPGVPPTWVAGGSIAPLAPVMVDGGRARPDRPDRVADPDLAAGRALAAALGAPDAAVVRGTAGAGARQLAVTRSAPLPELVRFMAVESDNVLAEALGREVAAARGLPRSYVGSAAGIAAVLADLGLPVAGLATVDASGLSVANRVPPALLTAALRLPEPQLAGLLPVAGFSGTLADRYLADSGGAATGAAAGAGVVRAKTGRLPAVSALAGYVETADGRLLVFAFLAEAPPGGPVRASAALDRAVAALAACVCG